jgi:hypothetical protein
MVRWFARILNQSQDMVNNGRRVLIDGQGWSRFAAWRTPVL